jgi:hypothetical protein
MKTILLSAAIVFNLIILCLFYGCDLKSEPAPPAYTFYVQNNSQNSFAYILSNHFPDTTLDSITVQQSGYNIFFSPNSKTLIYYPKSLLPNFETSGILELFLINSDTLQKYSPQYIASKYLITKRYDLTYKDIIINDSVITYQ